MIVDFIMPERELEQTAGEAEGKQPGIYTPSSAGEVFGSNLEGDTEQLYHALREQYAEEPKGEYYGPGGMVQTAPERSVDPKVLQQRFPGVKGLNEPLPMSVAQSMSDEQARKEKIDEVAARRPSGVGNWLLTQGASAAASMLDPVDDAAFMVPIIGESRYAAWLARAGESVGLAGRLGVTAGVGAARGAAGGAILSGVHAATDPDMTLGEAAQDTLSMSVGGALLHTALSFRGDVLGRRFLETPEGQSAAGDAELHDIAARVAASQIGSGNPVDVQPVFDAAKYSSSLMQSASRYPLMQTRPSPEAVTRFDNAVLRAGGMATQEDVKLQQDVDQAEAAPNEDKALQGRWAELERTIEQMRQSGRLTPEDEATLNELEVWEQEQNISRETNEGPATAKPRAPIERRNVAADVAFTSAGREVPVQYAVVEAADLLPSQTQAGSPNPAYPAELQPRDRTRAVSDAQIASIAQNLNPRLLDRSPTASEGAPIIAPDGTVESGNGRVLAVQRAYKQNMPTADAYRQYLADQGYPVEKMTAPVLVRVREGEMSADDRQAFVREANQSGTMGYSATELAMADARALQDSDLAHYRGGDVESAANRPFVRAFMERAVSPSERPAMIGADGAMSQDAIRRVRNALLAKAYGDAALVSTVAESADGSIKAIGGAMTDAGADWSRMRALAASGKIPREMDQTAQLLSAVRLIERARSEGRNVAEFVGQSDIFTGRAIDPETEAWLRLMFRDTRNWTRPTGRDTLAEALRFYAEEAQKVEAGRDLLGQEPVKPTQILTEAKRRQERGRYEQAGRLFGSEARAGQGVRAASGAGDGSGDEETAPGRGEEAARAGGRTGGAPEGATPVGRAEGTSSPRVGGAYLEARGERAQLADDLIAHLPTKPSPEEAKIIDAVNALAQRMTPGAEVHPARHLEQGKVFRTMSGGVLGGEVTGATYVDGARKLIAWSLASPDVKGTFRHEAVHWLRNSGFFGTYEWQALEKAAAEHNWRSAFDIEARYPDASEELKTEEAIAEAFGKWRRAPDWLPQGLRPIFERLAELLAQIRDFIRRKFGAEADLHDVFSRIASGEIGTRPAAPIMEGAQFGMAETRKLSAEEQEFVERKRLTAMADIAKRAAIMDYIDHARANGLSLAHGITAKMRGISESIQGARDSTESDTSVNRQRYLGALISGLEKVPGAQVAWHSRSLTAEWTRELFELNTTGGRPGITNSALALKIARAVHAAQTLAKFEANRAGAWLGDYQGYIARTQHDPVAIHKAGYEAWRDFTLQLLNHEKTFGELPPASVEKYMLDSWHAFSTGIHLSSDRGVPEPGAATTEAEPPAALEKSENVARRVSQSRVFHWLDADSWRAYQMRFGQPDIELGVAQGLMRAARDVALMKRWGSNPRFSFEKILRDVRARYREDHDALSELAKQEPRLREEFRHLTGEAAIPKNDLAYRIVSGSRAIEDIAKLNQVVFAHLSVGATKPYQLRFLGMGSWQAYTAALRNLAQDRSPQGRAILENLHANATGQIQQLMHGYEPFADVPGAISRIQMLNMRLGGLPWFLGREKAGTTWEVANLFGQNVSKPFGQLNQKIQRILSLHAITPTEWEALRTAPDHDKDARGFVYLTPKAADRATDAAIDRIAPARIMASAGPEDAARIRSEVRNDLAMKLAALYSDTADRSVISPGIAERALFTRYGGAYAGPLIGQYKTWATAAVRQMWGQACYGMGRGEAVKSLAGLAATMTAMGAARSIITDGIAGKEPDVPNGDLKHDALVLSRWVVAGGGMGIFGDYILGTMLRSPSGNDLRNNVIGAAAGPVIEDTAQTLGLAYDALRGLFSEDPAAAEAKTGDAALRDFISHLPVVNTFYVRMVLNWLFLDRLQEMTNPGYLERYQDRVKKQTGQDFFLPPATSYLGAPAS